MKDDKQTRKKSSWLIIVVLIIIASLELAWILAEDKIVDVSRSEILLKIEDVKASDIESARWKHVVLDSDKLKVVEFGNLTNVRSYLKFGPQRIFYVWEEKESVEE